MKEELTRRQSLEDRLFDYFLAHPRTWHHAQDLRPVAGDAWRSRLTNVRRRMKALGYDIEWNHQNGGASAYMLRPIPLGRDGARPVGQPGLWS